MYGFINGVKGSDEWGGGGDQATGTGMADGLKARIYHNPQ